MNIKTIETKSKIFEFQEFKSNNELANYLNSSTINSNWKSYKEYFSNNFSGIESVEKAFSYLSNGWEYGFKQIQKSINKEYSKNKEYRIIKKDLYGFAPNITAFLEGNPYNMNNIKKEYKKDKIINILYDGSASSQISTNELLNSGLNLIKVIKKLELQGYRINLKSGVFTGLNSNLKKDKKETSYIRGFTVDLKKALQPLQMQKIIYEIANPSFLRVIFFDFQNKSEVFKNITSEKYLNNRGTPLYYFTNNYIIDKSDIKKAFKNYIYLNYKDAERGTEFLINKIFEK